jgi:AcrR family transcriptional regulator
VSQTSQSRSERRAKARHNVRSDILSAARRVAKREGAGLSLRNVAAEAGFTPAALYAYFRNKDELLLALAADDLAKIARTMQAVHSDGSEAAVSKTLSAVLALLSNTETLAAAAIVLSSSAGCTTARVFNGRLIAALSALAAATKTQAKTREGQMDVILMAATLTGLAVLIRSRRLEILGFAADEVLGRLRQMPSGN